MVIKEPKYKHDFFNGIIEGENVRHYVKKYEDVFQIYNKNDKNICKEKIMYEVYTIKDNEKASLLWGLTIIKPIVICGEFNMTRGHFHVNKEEAEIYFGLSGKGLLLLMDEKGECYAESVYKGSIHYIDGKYAHRLINSSEEILKVGACWNERAGHDYTAIEKNGFTERVFKE